MANEERFSDASWLRDEDERVLEYLLETGGYHRASEIERNTATDLTYGAILESLSRLEEHGLIEQQRWRSYRLADAGHTVLNGLAAAESSAANDSTETAAAGDDQHELKQLIQSLDYQGDVATVRKLRDEGRRTVDHQLDTLDDIDTKAMKILRVNILLVGFILTAFTFGVEEFDTEAVLQFGNEFVGIGISALLISSALAAFVYTASDTEAGMKYSYIHKAIDADLTNEEFEIGAANSYANWIEFNDETIIRNAPIITLTSFLVIVGIVNLSIGVYRGLDGAYPWLIGLAANLSLVGLALKTGIRGQLKRYRRLE